MAVTLYFPFSSIFYLIPIALYAAYMIALSIFLILASKDRTEENQNGTLLKIAAIINIISSSVLFFIPISYNISGSIPDEQRMILDLLIIVLPSLIIYVPSIFTFGVTFIIIGNKNKDRAGNYLLLSGIFWLIFTTWASICLLSPLTNYPQLISLLEYVFHIFPEIYLFIIFNQVLAIGNIFSILGVIFLLIHSFINKNRNLKIAGFIYIIGINIVSLGLIPLYISMM